MDASYASLGLIRGTYVYTWGTGAHADTLTVNVGSISSVSGGAGPVPEASTWAMMLAGFTGLGALALRKKKTTLALTWRKLRCTNLEAERAVCRARSGGNRLRFVPSLCHLETTADAPWPARART